MLISKNKKIILFFLVIIFIFSIFPLTQVAKAQYAQYWLEYKDSSNIHHISDPFDTKPLCETWWTQNGYTLGTVIKDCFQYAGTPPTTPEPCILPQVLDPTTNSCITPAPTCPPPQTLNTTTNTCTTPNSKTTYTLLAPLPGLDGVDQTIDTQKSDTNPCPFGKYLNIMIKLFFGIAGVLAVVMIVMGGIEYMTSELVSSKEAGKESIRNALLGLLLALGAWLILNTLNPDLLNVCLNTLPKAEITISPEGVTNAGSGVDVGGTIVKISNGSAVACIGGIVNIPSDMGSGQICKDLLDRLQVLKSKNPGWKINSTIRNGNAASSCHYNNSPNSGNCADLQITNNPQGGYTKDGGSTNLAWGDFCVAVAQTGGLNFLNEASRVEKCEKLINYQAYAQTTGPHLHVNYIGGQGSSTQGEVYNSVYYVSNKKMVVIVINNYDKQKEHKFYIENKGFVYGGSRINENVVINGTVGNVFITLPLEVYNRLKGPTTASVDILGIRLGTKDLVIN